MNKEFKGFFVTFEGCDGCGKTTVMDRVKAILLKKGYPVVITREPGGVDISEQIRNVILDNKNKNEDLKTEVLLYTASRRQHLVEKLIPLLENGNLVLCDRFVDSSLAYQGYGRGIGFEKVKELNEFVLDGYWPNVTYFLDVKPIDGLRRITKDKTHEENRLDLEKLEFHNKVYEGYKELVKKFPERILVVYGYQEINKEAEGIAKDIEERWMKRNSK